MICRYFHFIFTTTLWGRNHCLYHPRFTDLSAKPQPMAGISAGGHGGFYRWMMCERVGLGVTGVCGARLTERYLDWRVRWAEVLSTVPGVWPHLPNQSAHILNRLSRFLRHSESGYTISFSCLIYYVTCSIILCSFCSWKYKAVFGNDRKWEKG